MHFKISANTLYENLNVLLWKALKNAVFFNEVEWHFVCIFSPLFSFLLKLETQDATG